MNDEEMAEFINEAVEQYREVTLEFLEALDDEDAPDVVVALLHAVAHEQGHVEGMAALLGNSKEDRAAARASSRRQGMEEALANHDEGPCEGCRASEELRLELFAN